MARISKHKLADDIAEKIWRQLYETVGRLSAAQSTSFLHELLGDAEQLMLAKRLAAIILVHEGHSSYAISNTLKMSPATITKLRENYANGQYDSIVSGMKKNKADYEQFIETLLDIIHLGLPRYAGPNRWKLLKK